MYFERVLLSHHVFYFLIATIKESFSFCILCFYPVVLLGDFYSNSFLGWSFI